MLTNSQSTNVLSTRPIIYVTLLLVFFSLCAFSVNFFIYKYPGNYYLPPNTSAVTLSLILVYGGVLLQFGNSSLPLKAVNEVIFFYLMIAAISLATNAIQYTPFPIIDKQIMHVENFFHININAVISWTHSRPRFKHILEFIYDSLDYEIAYFPLILIAARRWYYVREYYFLMLISALMGFSFYYFFPTTAPASIITSPYFSEAQHATSLKFMQIHQHIKPTTMDGGMISLPSFHIIWAWFSLYLIRCFRLAFIILLPINLLLVFACVLLGWHYPLDILGSIFIILLSHALYNYYCVDFRQVKSVVT
jgi:hypothetical protein